MAGITGLDADTAVIAPKQLVVIGKRPARTDRSFGRDDRAELCVLQRCLRKVGQIERSGIVFAAVQQAGDPEPLGHGLQFLDGGHVLKKQAAVLHRPQGQNGLEKQIFTGMSNDIHNTESFLLGCFPILYHFTILNTSPFWSFSQEKGGKKGRLLCVPMKKTNVPV